MASLAEVISSLSRKAELTAEDALSLRRIVYGETLEVTEAEAGALIVLTRNAQTCSAAWESFYLEALTDYIVRQERPSGYVDDAKADWIMARLGPGDVAPIEADLLVHILETAEATPAPFCGYVLFALKALVLAQGRPHGISKSQVELLRRAVFAVGGDGNVEVTRREAELLFDLNDALHDAANDPSWPDLFVRAVANSVLCVQTYVDPGAERELHDEAFLADTQVNPLRFFGAMLHPAQMLKTFEAPAPDILQDWRRREAADQAAQASAKSVTPEEAQWLARRLAHTREMDANERQLIQFLVDNASQIDPALTSAVEALHRAPGPPALASAAAQAAPGPEPKASFSSQTPAGPVFGQRLRLPGAAS